MEGENDDYDLGSGAGWYVDGQVVCQLRHASLRHRGAAGHRGEHLRRQQVSALNFWPQHFGGHGTIAFRDPASWTSVSAFAPVANPTNTPWGRKAFKAYLGSVAAGDARRDQTAHVQGPVPLLIDQGTEDQFLAQQLHPDAFKAAALAVGQPMLLRQRPGDHLYHLVLPQGARRLSCRRAEAQGQGAARDCRRAVQSSSPHQEQQQQQQSPGPIQCKAAVA